MKLQVEDITKKTYAKIEPKDIYATLWRCRDFELSHLWQRSVFLTAFLLLVYTGYGALILNVFTLPTIDSFKLKILLLVGLVILLIGMMFSQLWIMMAKGSKAWYEVYENAIYEIEHSPVYATEIVISKMPKDGVIHGEVMGLEKPDDSLWTVKAGTFSPSKINIMIGQISFGLLFLAYMLQVSLMSLKESYVIIQDGITTFLVSMILLISVLCFSCHVLKQHTHSSYLDKDYCRR